MMRGKLFGVERRLLEIEFLTVTKKRKARIKILDGLLQTAHSILLNLANIKHGLLNIC